MIVILIRNIAHLQIKIISVGIVGERGCFPFLFFTRERDLVSTPSGRVGKRVRNYSVCMRIQCRIISVKRLFWKKYEL